MPLYIDLLTAMGPSYDGFFLQSPDESADSPLDLMLNSYIENRNGRRRAIQLLPSQDVGSEDDSADAQVLVAFTIQPMPKFLFQRMPSHLCSDLNLQLVDGDSAICFLIASR